MGRDGDRNANDAERQRRLDALRALAGQTGGQPDTAQRPKEPAMPAKASVIRPPRRRGGGAPRPAWQIIVAGALAIAVVLAGALVALRLMDQPPARSVSSAPDPLVVPVSRAGMACLINASWSPDGKRIAALMSPAPCGQSGGQSNGQSSGGTALVFFDGALAHPGAPIALDSAILRQGLPQSVQQNPALMIQAGVAYDTMQWSPDSTQVAVLAGGPVPSATPDTTGPGDYFWALAVVNAATGALRVVATPPEPSTAFTGDNSLYNPNSFKPVLAWRFDLISSPPEYSLHLPAAPHGDGSGESGYGE